MRFTALSFALAAGLASQAALAETVNFETLPDGALGTKTVTVSGVTFTGPEELYNHSSGGFAGRGGSICSLDVSEFTCEADLDIDFNGTVRRLRFTTLGYNPGDLATVTIYRGDRVKGTVTIDANKKIDLSAFHRITRIEIDDASTGAGFSYGLFHFRPADDTPARRHHRPKKRD